jgi:hypothetical protein
MKYFKAFLLTLSLLIAVPAMTVSVLPTRPVLAVDLTGPICDPNQDGDRSDALDPVACGITDKAGAQSKIVDVIGDIVQILVFLVGAISVLMLVIGAIRYVVSGGDPAGTKGAKDSIIYALIGLIIAAVAQLLVIYVIGRL